MRITIIAILILITTQYDTSIADPAIQSTSGSAVHGGALSVTGSGFGIKNPAAPLLWDDGEGSYGLSSKYIDYSPTSASSTYNLQYRSGTFRSMSNPHARGTRFIAGGHEDNRPYDLHAGNTVGMMADFGANAAVAYVFYYHALDPAWPTNAYQAAPWFNSNHKTINYEPSGATGIYSTPTHYKIFTQGGVNGGSPEIGSAQLSILDNSESSSVQMHCNNDRNYCFPTSSLRGRWAHWEEITAFSGAMSVTVLDGSSMYKRKILDVPSINFGSISGVSVGGYFCWQTNVITLSGWTGPDGNGEYSTPLSVQTQLLNKDHLDLGAGGFPTKGTVGSLTSGQWGYSAGRAYVKDNPAGHTYYATDSTCGSIGGSEQHGGHANAFRYFDDVYVDTTFARVMLANNAVYENATIIEPQIPSAWSDSSITVKVNLGRLPLNGRAFLFVFDAANRHSSGTCVPLGTGTCIDAVGPGAPHQKP